MEPPEELYHGTCIVFILLALERKGKFGPDYDKIRFTSDFDHAKMLAEG